MSHLVVSTFAHASVVSGPHLALHSWQKQGRTHVVTVRELLRAAWASQTLTWPEK